eukprot:752812-Hanusia_phi.AAC.1
MEGGHKRLAISDGRTSGRLTSGGAMSFWSSSRGLPRRTMRWERRRREEVNRMTERRGEKAEEDVAGVSGEGVWDQKAVRQAAAMALW